MYIIPPNCDLSHVFSMSVAVLTDLGIGHIETVLLAFSEKRRNFETLQASWLKLERLHKCFKVFTLGVADLSKAQLEGLYNWAEVRQKY